MILWVKLVLSRAIAAWYYFFDTIYFIALDKYIEYTLIWERAYSYACITPING
jgi:hypothetical protein